jgi:hypothetical protein
VEKYVNREQPTCSTPSLITMNRSFRSEKNEQMSKSL